MNAFSCVYHETLMKETGVGRSRHNTVIKTCVRSATLPSGFAEPTLGFLFDSGNNGTTLGRIREVVTSLFERATVLNEMPVMAGAPRGH